MKKDVAAHLALCDVCQRVKAEYQRPAGLLQPLKVPEWKWEKIGMDFIVGLPRTRDGYDSIWVIVDRLTKVAHFIPVKTTYTGVKLTELYNSRIVCLYGVPKKIVSDQGTQFTSRFWQKLHESMDTKLNFSSAYHPQTDGQTERTNQILEDMLRACALKNSDSWNKSLPYAEFAYNNSYQSSIKMAPLRLCMEENVEHHYFGTRLVRVISLDQIAYGKRKSKLRSLERISKRHSHVRRVMLTLGEERWFWKSVIMHISECHPFVVYGGLMLE
jgi:hypothetical protein